MKMNIKLKSNPNATFGDLPLWTMFVLREGNVGLKISPVKTPSGESWNAILFYKVGGNGVCLVDDTCEVRAAEFELVEV
jgi:hypothetical protein